MSVSTALLLNLFTLFLIGGCVAALFIGIWILVRPETFLRANKFLSQWYTTRKITKPLMVPRRTERFVYRYHRVLGFFIVACALYVLYGVCYEYDKNSIITAFFGSEERYPPAAWLVPALAMMVGVGGLFALVVGGFLVVRPSLLKGFETWANRWVSARSATKFLDTMWFGPDQWVMRHPRVVAILLILGSAYALFRLIVMWISTGSPGFGVPAP